MDINIKSVNHKKLLLLSLPPLILISSCGGSAITACQENGYAQFIDSVGAQPTREEMNEITRICVDNSNAFD